MNSFYSNFEEEVEARGSKHSVFNVYNINKEKIIKITLIQVVGEQKKSWQLYCYRRELGVKEYTSQNLIGEIAFAAKIGVINILPLS